MNLSVDLPTGWQVKKLGQVLRKTGSRDPRETPEDTFLYVDIGSVEEGRIIGPREIRGPQAPSRARKVIREGDVIFSMTRPYLRAIAEVPPELDNQICSTGFFVMRPCDESLVPRWLYAFALSDGCMNQVVPKMRGASYPAVTEADMQEIDIPVPPLNEQERMTVKLDRIDRAIRFQRQAIGKTGALLQAILADVFDVRGTLPEGWRRLELGRVIELSQYGISKRADGGPYSIVRMNNLTMLGDFDWRDLKSIELDDEEVAKYRLEPGDILFNRTNSDELVGKCAVYNGEPDVAVFASYLIRVRTKAEELHSRYAAYFLISPPGRYQLMRRARRAVGQANINAKELASVPIPIAPLPVQRTIVDRLGTVSNVLRRQQGSLSQLQLLMKSALDKAFQGKL